MRPQKRSPAAKNAGPLGRILSSATRATPGDFSVRPAPYNLSLVRNLLSTATSHVSTAQLAVWKLFVLRFFTMLSYSMTYIAIPALLFKGTRSATVAGLALVVEGVLRAVVSLLARRFHGRMGSRATMWLAESMRLLGGAALLVCLWHFNIVLLVAASCIYQFGYLSVVLEQELRCGQLGVHVLRGQSFYRAAEVLAVFPVLAAAFAFAGYSMPLLPLVVLGASGAVVHLALARVWLKGELGQRSSTGSTRQGLWFLLSHANLRRGLVASTLAFSVFALSLSAAPFLLKGHSIMGVSLSQQAGLAGFKSTAALLALALTFGMARLLRGSVGALALLGAGTVAPLTLLASQLVDSGLAAALLLGIAPALAITVLMAQRSERQTRIPATSQSDVTTAYLAVECLSVSVAGAVLASSHVMAAMGVMAAVLAWALWPRR